MPTLTLSVTAEAITTEACYRFHYLRTYEMILVYKGSNLDTTESHDKIRDIRRENFIDTVEAYLDRQ
jgi:hypothetical protein